MGGLVGPGAASGFGWWRAVPGIVASDGRWLVERIWGASGMTEVFLGVSLRERHGGLAWIYKA